MVKFEAFDMTNVILYTRQVCMYVCQSLPKDRVNQMNIITSEVI